MIKEENRKFFFCEDIGVGKKMNISLVFLNVRFCDRVFICYLCDFGFFLKFIREIYWLSKVFY